MAPGNVLDARLEVALSVKWRARRFFDVPKGETKEPLPAGAGREARGRSNQPEGRLIARGTAQVWEVMDARVARDFAQALAFRREVAAQLAGVGSALPGATDQLSAVLPIRSKIIESLAEITASIVLASRLRAACSSAAFILLGVTTSSPRCCRADRRSL